MSVGKTVKRNNKSGWSNPLGGFGGYASKASVSAALIVLLGLLVMPAFRPLG
jgi:hypothetical protein